MVIHCYCYCNKVSVEVKRFNGRFIVFRDFVATLMFSLQLLLFGCNFDDFVATIQFPPNYTRFPYKKAAFRESVGMTKAKTFIYTLFRFSIFLVIVATFIDIIATFLIIIATSFIIFATLGVIVATIQFPPNSTFFIK